MIDSNTIIVGDYSRSLKPLDMYSKKNQQGNLKWHTRSGRSNCYLQNTAFQSVRVNILLKCTWNENDLKDRLYVRAQNKF